MPVAAAVGDLGDLMRIAAQDLDLVALLAGVIAVGEKVSTGDTRHVAIALRRCFWFRI